MVDDSMRPPRRQVRSHCSVRIGDTEYRGWTRNVSAGGLYVRIARDEIDPDLLVGRSAVRLNVTLPKTEESLEFDGFVVWSDSDDHDDTGAPVVGLGIECAPDQDAVRAVLQNFVDTFRYTVVVVDDEVDNLELSARGLQRYYDVVGCSGGRDALDVMESREVAVLVTDQRMPEMSGLELLQSISQRYPQTNTVRAVVSAYRDYDQMQMMINEGELSFFLAKPYRPQELKLMVDQCVEKYARLTENERLRRELERANAQLKQENASLRKQVRGVSGFEDIVGESAGLKDVLQQLSRIRESNVTAHITGETGTGKELVARALHHGGARKDGPFVALNCAGMTETLLQSTLFGHKKGAFTGADRDKPGVFQEADGGTLFLDEVAELSPAVQAALLRAIQEGEVIPVGSNSPVKVDVRLISATHKDLREEVKLGSFREDLYYRLVVISVRMPPLRERIGDVELLAHHFLESYCERHERQVPGFGRDCIRALLRYHWPGNVRELQNEVERMVILGEPEQKLSADLLSPHISDGAGASGVVETVAPEVAGNAIVVDPEVGYDDAMGTLSRVLIERALENNDGVVARAARELQIERSRLAKLRKRLGL